MTIQIIDGFDTYDGIKYATGAQTKWVLSSTSNVAIEEASLGGQCMHLTGGSSIYAYRQFPSTTQLSMGFALKVSGLSNIVATDSHILLGYEVNFLPASHINFGLRVNQNGSISAVRTTNYGAAGSVIATSAAGKIVESNDHFVEMELVVNDTAGRFTIWVDGVSVLTQTDVDTKALSVATVNTVCLSPGTGVGSHFYIDDLWITDSPTKLTGGPLRVSVLQPNSDITTQWTPVTGSTHYTMVDDTVAQTSDYVYTNTPDNLEEFGLTDLVGTPSTIKAVQVVAYANKSHISERTIQIGVKSGSSITDSETQTLKTGTNRFEKIIETDPATSEAWSSAAVNALKVRTKLSS